MGVTRIQHNLSAMNSMSNYQANSKNLTGNLEKLSSGYRINSAADDAAGLAISEKMRSQIAGLQKAQDNANDGISLVQTAEGALTEVNSMLTRLKSLATQSANGTYEDGVDRANIQEETDALLSEIDRISESTNFNGINLLDGSLDGKSQVQNIGVDNTKATKGKYTAGGTLALGDLDGNLITGTDGKQLKKEDIGKSIDYVVTWQTAEGEEKTSTISFTFKGNGNGEIHTKANELNKNYFEDDTGKKYFLGNADGKLSVTDLQEGIEKGLKANQELSAEFIMNDDTTAGQYTFENKKEGTSAAKIIGTEVRVNFSSSEIKASNMAGSGTATITSVAYDSMQRIKSADIKVANKNSDTDQVKDAIFEIDGKKFILVDGSATSGTGFQDTQRSSLGDDVTVIETKTAIANLGAGDDDEKARVANEITRVSGHEMKVVKDGTNGTLKAESTADLVAGDLVFTKDKLKLDGNELSLQIGDTNKDYQKVSVRIQDMSSKGLGLTGLDLSNQDSAGKAVDTIQDAINKVSTQRGQLGALQNRLDHTLNNLDATEQNITAAESQIRDVDMAKEMTAYSKNNILVQAAQSMLAQANSLPQGVLSLLQ